MSEFRFIHSSDLHLGRRFGSFPDEVRDRLTPARHGAIDRLAAAAADHRAAHVLIAGDLFDVETPAPRVWRQALHAMGAARDVTWWILPGNHDSLAAEPLWDGVRALAPANVRLLDSAGPVEMADGVQLLPAPVVNRFTGTDATAWMSGCDTPPGALRIGLAHGGVTAFGSEDATAEVIPPDRAETARLDYLALGDWHGTLRIGPRTWYSGTPERDRFKHDGRGACLAVTLGGPGAVPVVEVVETGEFDWAMTELELTPSMDPLDALHRVLPPSGRDKRDIVMSLRITGRIRLPDRSRLRAAIESERPLYWHLEVDDHALASEVSPDDLDSIAESGALRLAADALLQDIEDAARAEEERKVARAALDRLYAMVREAGR